VSARPGEAARRAKREVREQAERYAAMIEYTYMQDGVRFTKLKPGTSYGAETNPDCYRVGWAEHKGTRNI